MSRPSKNCHNDLIIIYIGKLAYEFLQASFSFKYLKYLPFMSKLLFSEEDYLDGDQKPINIRKPNMFIQYSSIFIEISHYNHYICIYK